MADARPAAPDACPNAVPAACPNAVVVLHGLTSTTESVQGVVEALAGAGFTVHAPLLPGHGTTPEDLDTTGWDDWVAASEEALMAAAATGRPAVVFGLSMGGSLACRVAADHPEEVAGLVLVNPFIDPPAESFREALRGILAAGFWKADAIRGDMADPSAAEVGYDVLPIRPLLSLSEGLEDLLPRLGAIACPVLLMTSRVDHVVPTVSSDMVAERVSGPVERVWLERSYHVATLDYDRQEIERRTVEFANKVTAG